MSPTQRALKVLRDQGWTVAIVEKWNPHAKVRQDLFGFIDLLAMKQGVLLGVQVTSTSNMNARKDKALESPNLRAWLITGNQFEVWGFAKKGPRGKRKLWQLDRQPFEIIGGVHPYYLINGTNNRPTIGVE